MLSYSYEGNTRFGIAGDGSWGVTAAVPATSMADIFKKRIPRRCVKHTMFVNRNPQHARPCHMSAPRRSSLLSARLVIHGMVALLGGHALHNFEPKVGMHMGSEPL